MLIKLQDYQNNQKKLEDKIKIIDKLLASLKKIDCCWLNTRK